MLTTRATPNVNKNLVMKSFGFTVYAHQKLLLLNCPTCPLTATGEVELVVGDQTHSDWTLDGYTWNFDSAFMYCTRSNFAGFFTFMALILPCICLIDSYSFSSIH